MAGAVIMLILWAENAENGIAKVTRLSFRQMLDSAPSNPAFRIFRIKDYLRERLPFAFKKCSKVHSPIFKPASRPSSFAERK
jgi:hypothetical protein